MKLARRRFLSSVAAFGAAIGASVVGITALKWVLPRLSFSRSTREGLVSHARARHYRDPELLKLGGLYLAGRRPGARSVESLLNELAVPALSSTGLSHQGLNAAVADLIRRDFADERIVSLDGWVIAVTEARLLALASLVAN